GFAGVTVLVTHDPLDALTLADRLVFVEAGRVVQSGPPAEVVARPRDAYVAHVVGLNLYAGETRSQTLVESSVGPVVTSGHDHVGPSWVSFAPAAVSLYIERPGGSPRNAWECTVRAIEIVGQTARVRLSVNGTSEQLVAEVTTVSVAKLRLHTGSVVWATVKATEVSAYPA
ncbi:MAG: TOBE domain-containing protein, partial [Dermatophilaceae bacterium]